MSPKVSAPIAQEMETVVKNLMKEAYPDGTKGDVHIEAHGEDANLQFVISAADKLLTLTKEIKK